MSYKHPFFVSLLVLICANTNAQDTLNHNKSYDPYKSWCAKLPLLNFLDLNAPNLEMAAERRFDWRNSVQLLAGISTDISTVRPRPHDYSAINGFRIKGEYRRYFHVRRKVSFFLAGDVFYTTYKHYSQDSFISQANAAHYADNFYVQKKMAGADLKWGVQFHTGKHFMFETFAGLGFKHKSVTQTGRTMPTDDAVPPPPPIDFNPNAESNALGSYTTVSLPVNFVVGYIFR